MTAQPGLRGILVLVWLLQMTAPMLICAQEIADIESEEETILDDRGTVVDTEELLLAPSAETMPAPDALVWDLRSGASGTSLRFGGAGRSSPLMLRADDRGRYSGNMRAGFGAWEFHGGMLRFDHGFGLIARGAGLWHRVSAGSALQTPGHGAAGYIGVDPARRLTGAVLSYDRDGSGLEVLISDTQWEGRRLPLRAARLSGCGGFSVAAITAPDVLAGSVALDRPWTHGRWAFEVSQSDAGRTPRTAMAARIAWIGRGKRLEAMAVAGEDLQTKLSDGLPLVPGPSGSGWAIRGTVGAATAGRWSMLATGGRADHERSGILGAESRLRFETTCVWKTSGGLSLDGRARRVVDRRWGWAASRPWEPPGLDWKRVDWSFALRVAGEWQDWQLTAGIADRWFDDGIRSRSRHLVRFQADRNLGKRGRLRFGHLWSWGGALDLMTADAPAPGILAVRHARHLGALWSVGWSGAVLSLRISAAGEIIERDDDEGPRRFLGGRIRVRGGL